MIDHETCLVEKLEGLNGVRDLLVTENDLGDDTRGIVRMVSNQQDNVAYPFSK